jgi:hypothetical protein
LSGFKKAHGINRVRLHGEGDVADLVSVETVRKELPPFLADTPLHKIYNFDETGMVMVMMMTMMMIMMMMLLLLLLLLLLLYYYY